MVRTAGRRSAAKRDRARTVIFSSLVWMALKSTDSKAIIARLVRRMKMSSPVVERNNTTKKNNSNTNRNSNISISKSHNQKTITNYKFIVKIMTRLAVLRIITVITILAMLIATITITRIVFV